MSSLKIKSKSILRWLRRHKIVTTLLVLIVLAGLGAVADYRAQSAERHNFEEARSAIDSIYADTVAQIGQPDNYKLNNYCNMSQEEFASPTYSCGVETDFVYGVINENDANTLHNKIQNIVSDHKDLKASRPLEPALLDHSSAVAYEPVTTHSAIDEYIYTGLKCYVGYAYDTPDEIDLAIKDKSNKPLEISINCNGNARTPYYTVTH